MNSRLFKSGESFSTNGIQTAFTSHGDAPGLKRTKDILACMVRDGVLERVDENHFRSAAFGEWKHRPWRTRSDTEIGITTMPLGQCGR